MSGRNKKKNKFKANERSSSSVRDKYSDPAFTEDVRHLAFPLRRNSGPDSEFMKMLKKKSMKKSSDESTSIKQVDRNRKANKSADFLCDHSSSSESLENIISTYKMRAKKGSSFDTSATFEEKPQMKPKRSSWFLRDRSREKFFKRASLDFTIASSTSFDAKSRRNSKFHRQNATEYNTGDSSTTQNDEPIIEPKKSSSNSGLSKFQLGKRLLKGEIGIRSFNYYLLKEGLKKRGNDKNEVPAPKSRSEENIYEEIYFRHDLSTPKPRAPPDLPPMNKLMSTADPTKVVENCANCEICLQEAAALDKNMTCDKCLENGHSIMMSSDGYARMHRNNSSDNLIDYLNRQSNRQQPMLTFQSYNPNYPNIYKMETTPLVTPVEYGTIGENMTNVYQSYKSAAPMLSKRQSSEFYTRPNYLYPSSISSTTTVVNVDKVKQERAEMLKTNSSTSIRSCAPAENEIIYNGSQKSVHSNKSSGSNHDGHFQMSDSSLGDSLFSSDPKKRGFGSSESCVQRKESLEHEKCSFSDTTCNFRTCDCSSSYFSSDFDDNNIYNQTNLKPENYYEQQRANLCHDELSKRSKKNQNHHYEVLQQQRANDREKMSSNHLTTLSASAQQKTSSSSTESSMKKKKITSKNLHEHITTATTKKYDEKITRHSQQLKDEKISSKEMASRNKKDNDVVKSPQSTTTRRLELAENVNDDNFAECVVNSSKETDKVETKDKKEISKYEEPNNPAEHARNNLKSEKGLRDAIATNSSKVEKATKAQKSDFVVACSTLKAPEENNNKASSDDDDSVFINENKSKCKTPARSNVSSAMLIDDGANVSSSKLRVIAASTTKTTESQNLNISHETDVQSETVTRDQQDRKLVKNEKKKLNETPTKELVDFNKLPLPDIPTKSKKPQLSKGKSSSKDSTASATSKIQAKWKQLTEKEYFKKMHYRNSGNSVEKSPKPTYLFGESKQQKDGIFLNRSGWLQTTSNQQQRFNDAKQSKNANSKLVELISRSEARKSAVASQQFTKDENVTILKIDPKNDTRKMPSSDRPGYLPVKTNLTKHGPPPTPILSPPPAFQDENIRNRIMEMRTGTRIHLAVAEHDTKVETNASKGMVFSRSFEFDSRQKTQAQASKETFSRSFDFDFQLNDKSYPYETFLTRFDKANKFSSLTGVSPNYLTKQPPPTENFFPKAIPGNNLKLSNPNYYNPNYGDRRSQFLRPGNNFRSFDSNLASLNSRLNSCDSGARSDFSNDDLDEDPNDDDDDPSSSLALSYKSAMTASTTYQSRNQYRNPRSITPETSFDDHDLLSVNRSSSVKKTTTRSLTPDKRPLTPEQPFKSSTAKLTASQTSLMSRQSSGSRQSTLERQLQRHDESRISRSSSSSSDDVGGGVINRQSRRPPFKAMNNGDYKIRRSRSLQLSERSPSRSQMQKVVVRIGNTTAPQSTNSTLTSHREKPVDYGQIRNKTTLTLPSNKYNNNGGHSSLRNSDISLTCATTKSHEMLDFNSNAGSHYGFDSDTKSKSFDDDFCYNTQATRNQSNAARNVFSGNRAFSQDRVLLVPSSQHQLMKSLKNSPRNYGSRLRNHEEIYDIANSRRSPVMNYNNNNSRGNLTNALQFRDKSPSNRRSRDRESFKKSNPNYLKLRTTAATPNRSPNRSPSDSDDSINDPNVLKDKSLVTEYLIGLKRKQMAKRNATTVSSGSSTSSSSCESWPPPPPMNIVVKATSSAKKVAVNSKKCANLSSSDSSGNSVKIRVNTQKKFSRQNSPAVLTPATVTINGMHASRVNNSSIIFLGDCEMPITKTSSDTKTSGSDSVGVNASKKSVDYTQKIQIRSASVGESNQRFAEINQQRSRNQNYNRGKFFKPASSASDVPIQRRHFTRLQSRSLPKSFMRMRYRNPTDANEIIAMFPPHSPLQMRAVSSPSLTENITETPSKASQNYSTAPEPNSTSNHPNSNDAHIHNASSGSVLQKFKRTFFKNGKSSGVSLTEEPSETKHHRFGPLVWRSSKERRKTKTHRRDKCNSGDSGIQVELENDENLSENVLLQQQNMDTSPPFHNAKVRRANSAKVANSTIKSLSHNSAESTNPASITSKRSLSQPSDLDVIVSDSKMMKNIENIKHIDDEEGSDTDSFTSNQLEDIEVDDAHAVVYAEVLYPFQASGTNELALEKGALVQILKRLDGPWWWGRVKFDDIVDDDLSEIQHGWFPKDFVKLIPTFATQQHNHKFKSQLSSESDCDNHHHHLASLPPTSAAPTIASSQSNSELMKDNAIKELLEAEINYVKLLHSLVEGFIKEMRSYPEVFTLESIFLIFSNIDQIYRFQQSFLEALRVAIPNHRIAATFLEFQSSFMVYSQYCNTYPRALVELENLSHNKEANRILELCRIAQNLPELPLSAHLLAPIQRICRYPLHLSELVKHTKPRKEILAKTNYKNASKTDLEMVDSKELLDVSLIAMKRVTEMVNEGKRHSEYLSRIQDRIENFQGPSVNVHSTRLFLQTDAVRVSPNLWNNTYTLFLFDHQLIYCKKDLLKRTSYIYKGRIFLENCRILNLPDGKMFGVTLKNALRMYCETRNKWFDFCFRSSSSKMRFLNTLSAERQFCGGNLFVSEMTPGHEDGNLSDDNHTTSQEYDERGIDVEPQPNTNSNGPNDSPTKHPNLKFSDTLPKKPRKLSKDVQHPSQIIIDYNPAATTSSNGHKRRLGNWFRKSKSTNSTPSQSPTHHPITATSTVPSVATNSDSNSSSQSSPVNYPRLEKFKEGNSSA